MVLCRSNRAREILLLYTDDCSVEARGTAFSDNEHDDAEDARIFSTQRSSLPHNFATLIFPSLASANDIPAWMVSTDVPLVKGGSVRCLECSLGS